MTARTATGRGVMSALPRPPWLNRRGRASWLRIATLLLLALPAVLLALRAAAGVLGAEPIEAAINHTGTWGVRIFVVSLAISPLRRLAGAARLMDVRRMVGVGAFLYLFAHFVLFVADQSYDLAAAANEIVTRLYLTIGFVALLGLAALAATSTDTIVRALGGMRWRRLHQTVYGLIILGLIHALLQVRLQDYVEPLVLAGITAYLFALRWLTPRTGPIGIGRAALLSLGVTALIVAGEVAWLAGKAGADAGTILAVQFDTAVGMRPAWVVLGVTLALAATPMLRRPSRAPLTA